MLVFLHGCPEGSDGSIGGIAPSTTCTNTIENCVGGGNVQFCENSENNNCWYQVGSDVFNCDPGCDCTAAINDAGAACLTHQDITDSYVADYLLEKTKNIRLSRQLDAAYKVILGESRSGSE